MFQIYYDENIVEIYDFNNDNKIGLKDTIIAFECLCNIKETCEAEIKLKDIIKLLNIISINNLF